MHRRLINILIWFIPITIGPFMFGQLCGALNINEILGAVIAFAWGVGWSRYSTHRYPFTK